MTYEQVYWGRNYHLFSALSKVRKYWKKWLLILIFIPMLGHNWLTYFMCDAVKQSRAANSSSSTTTYGWRVRHCRSCASILSPQHLTHVRKPKITQIHKTFFKRSCYIWVLHSMLLWQVNLDTQCIFFYAFLCFFLYLKPLNIPYLTCLPV